MSEKEKNIKSFVEWLKQQDEKETLQQASFRLLCFRYYENRTHKGWIWTKAGQSLAPADAILCVYEHQFHFQTTIQSVIKAFE